MAAGAMEEAWGILWAGDIARVGGQEERGSVGEVGSAGKEGGGRRRRRRRIDDDMHYNDPEQFIFLARGGY